MKTRSCGGTAAAAAVVRRERRGNRLVERGRRRPAADERHYLLFIYFFFYFSVSALFYSSARRRRSSNSLLLLSLSIFYLRGIPSPLCFFDDWKKKKNARHLSLAEYTFSLSVRFSLPAWLMTAYVFHHLSRRYQSDPRRKKAQLPLVYMIADIVLIWWVWTGVQPSEPTRF